LIAILTSPCLRLLNHFPGRGKPGFGRELLPELEIEAAIVFGAIAQDPGHDHSSIH
jgi:hypothetical protein